jgi:hypothetical protein
LVSRIATWGGGLALFAMVFGVIGFDLGIMAAAIAALLGGIVVWGSNSSTAKEATKELAQATRRSGSRRHRQATEILLLSGAAEYLPPFSNKTERSS